MQRIYLKNRKGDFNLKRVKKKNTSIPTVFPVLSHLVDNALSTVSKSYCIHRPGKLTNDLSPSVPYAESKWLFWLVVRDGLQLCTSREGFCIMNIINQNSVLGGIHKKRSLQEYAWTLSLVLQYILYGASTFPYWIRGPKPTGFMWLKNYSP